MSVECWYKMEYKHPSGAGGMRRYNPEQIHQMIVEYCELRDAGATANLYFMKMTQSKIDYSIGHGFIPDLYQPRPPAPNNMDDW